MAEIHELIDRVAEPELKAQLRAAVDKLAKQKKFGLVFEEHLPECTPLYEVPVQKGRMVAKKGTETSDLYVVLTIKDGEATCLPKNGGDAVKLSVDELVSVAEFGEPIYPYLQPIDAVCHAPDSGLWHTLIEADNYHALQLLQYLYAGKVDCIYIDPPYNTGAKDWKYNNDYVDGNDQYRHSKWLSMMKKRLALAKKLLNPENSVLIVTIDEKEYLHLGCLLEEMFPNARTQMVTSVISAKGVVRAGQFSRVEEYIYIIEFGSSALHPGIYNMLDDEIKKESQRSIEWLGFRRRAPQAKRASRPNQFYPIFVKNTDGVIHSIGDVVKAGIDRNSIPTPVGCTALWPLSQDGDERLWSLVPEQARINLSKGYLRVNNWNAEEHTGTVYYLPSGTIEDIETGRATVIGRSSDNSVIAQYSAEGVTPPKRVWNLKSHNAETYGTNILNSIIGKRFDYPKSLYAVRDTIRFFVASKPNALVVDFFAGSGTTLHAVNLLNAEDGGHRRCILVTNNEVSADESKTLSAQGYQPGDPEWEKLGIAQYVTWPRTVCSIEGHDVKGQPLKGDYLGSELPMSAGFQANATYFKLGFLDKTSVALGQQFQKMLPTLWMKAGAIGPCPTLENGEIPPMLVLPENGFAVLTVESAFEEFARQVNALAEIKTVYLITDYEAGYRVMAKALHAPHTFQLYRDYLDNFRINTGRDNG